MNSIFTIINNRLELLQRAIKQAEKDETAFPNGRLRITRTTRQIRYYNVVDSGDTTGQYLSKSKAKIIKQLAQKDYNKQFLKAARAEQKKLENFLNQYRKQQAETTFEGLSDERKALVLPYILPDDMYARAWQSRPFRPSSYKPEKKIYDTRRGEKVRSKSEAIIADMLLELGIPYRYEYPVKMHDGTIRYPDFTLLKVKTREIIFFEHFGRLSEEDYRKETIEKMDIYRASGIYPGKNLMFSYETEENPLDINGIRKMLVEAFLS
jgi:hypothetical protein